MVVGRLFVFLHPHHLVLGACADGRETHDLLGCLCTLPIPLQNVLLLNMA